MNIGSTDWTILAKYNDAPLLAVRETGNGRIAVIGDNDLFAVSFGVPTENVELYTNIVLWLCGGPCEPPVSDAGEDQVIDEGDVVQLNGSASSDSDGNITTFGWDFDSKDGLWWNIGGTPDATGPTPTHIYGDDGVFNVTLKVTDDQNLSDIDIYNITVLNVNPTVTIKSAIMDVEISLRVAGSKWSNVGLTLYDNYTEIGYIEVERWSGSPDDNPTYENPALPTTLNVTKSYKAIVTYDPYPDNGDEIKRDQPNNGKDKQNNAGNPVWIIMKFSDGSEEKIHQTFNTQQSKKRNSDHWNHVEPWEVDLNGHLVGMNSKRLHISQILEVMTRPLPTLMVRKLLPLHI